MRVGATVFNQNYSDWDRFEAEERGEQVPSRPQVSDASIVAEELELVKIADETGFDSVWTVEHHFTPYTMVTNPLQYLSYLAGITQNVDLGTMVTVLPWHNPVRLAEDVNMLDHLLGEGRNIYCGVGRGVGRREYEGLKVDQNESRIRFNEGISVLRELLATGECNFKGDFYQFDNLRLRPQVTRDLSEYLWCAGGTDQTVTIIAEQNVRPLIIPTTTLDQALTSAKKYVDLRREAGHGDAVHTKLALWTFVAETEEEAREQVEQYMVEYSDSALRHYEMDGDHLGKIKGYEHYAAQSAALRANRGAFLRAIIDSHPWGTPEMVIERASELANAFGTDELMFVFRYGNMPLDMARSSMRLFAERVLPALHELSPAPLQIVAA